MNSAQMAGIMTSSIPRIGTSFLLRSKYIPIHRCACLVTVNRWHQRNEHVVSNRVYNDFKRRKHSTSSTSKQLYQKILLPQLGQNGTLHLRSNSKSIGQVDIIPQWRDDTMLELIPIVMPKDMQNNSDDRNEAHDNDHNSDVKEIQYDEESSSTAEQQTVSYDGLRFTLHRDGISTALGRKGSLVEVDVDGSALDDNNKKTPSLSQWWKLVATVPEKSNLTCNITKGNINVIGSKLEGDAHLSTSDGDIKVSKLRGHDVTLNNSCVGRSTSADDDGCTSSSLSSSSSPGLIYVRKGIEAQTVRISSSNRVRARMVNGSDVQVKVDVPATSMVGRNEDDTSSDEQTDKMLDEDDAGSRIDIGSLYISGSKDCEAALYANDVASSSSSSSSSSSGLVRVKSSHGHVTVYAKTKAGVKDQTNTFVDLGGVNGSCDVSLEVGGDSKDATILSTTPHEAPVTTRVHFDSLSPDSISTITSFHAGERSDEAIVSVTVDRKVEAELRLLSVPSEAESMSIDMDRLTSDELNDVESTLMDVEKCIQESESYNAANTSESISIETEAFDPVHESSLKLPESDCFQYKQGTMRNKSGEPDSRFDVRSSPSRGKINIDSAASQALSGFQGKTNDSDSIADDDLHLPLLAVATNGKIKLETLSWLGAIARRYGLEGQQELGRTASRRPRLIE